MATQKNKDGLPLGQSNSIRGSVVLASKAATQAANTPAKSNYSPMVEKSEKRSVHGELAARKPQRKKKVDPPKPLVVVKSQHRLLKGDQSEASPISASKVGQQRSLIQFQKTHLGENFNTLFKDKQLPFKYRTLIYLQQILFCKEVDEDITRFRTKEARMHDKWKFQDKMRSDITRTPILRDAPMLHEDALRIIEFYCFSHNINYC